MPTILSHAIVPLAAAAALGPKRIAPRVALLGAVLAVLPDADVIGFRFGLAYGAEWGHRGASHALLFALSAVLIVLAAQPKLRRWAIGLFLWASMALHGLLDSLTDGGKGVALYWPLLDQRFFAPWKPIRVSPIGAGFFSARGIETLTSELVWIWLPCAVLVAVGLCVNRRVPN
jgi:inner membrane protein